MSQDVILTIVSGLFGGTGVLTLIATIKERKANLKLTDANTVKVIQELYGTLVKDLETKISGLENKIMMLEDIVRKKDEQCRECHINNKYEKTK